ncbi:MAG: 2-oxoacid:acceptor oxidoreductase family protein [Candidatus Helarchaeota archaeon]|nr:2-oxoacid:acceptor oxidoreductase family protein [Candidatus Helarchaeota archaeon]
MVTEFNIVLVGTGGQGVILSSNILGWTAIKSDPTNKVRTAETHGMAQRGGTVIVHLRFGHDVESPLVKTRSADVILAFELAEAVRYLDFLKSNGILLVSDEILIPPVCYRGQHARVNPKACIGCGNCRINCNINTYFQNSQSFAVINSPASHIINGACEILPGCTGCMTCVEICRRDAIDVIKEISYPPTTDIANAFKTITNQGFILPVSKIAQELGDIRMLNTVMIGALFGFPTIPLNFEVVKDVIRELLPPKVVELNLKALHAGRLYVRGLLSK